MNHPHRNPGHKVACLTRIHKDLKLTSHEGAKRWVQATDSNGVPHALNTQIVCANSKKEGCVYYEDDEEAQYRFETLYLPEKGNIIVEDRRSVTPERVLEFTQEGAANLHSMLSAEDGRDVIVHCHAGMNRSVAIIVRYAMDYKKWGFDEARDYIRRINWEQRRIPPRKTLSNPVFHDVLRTYHDRGKGTEAIKARWE